MIEDVMLYESAEERQLHEDAIESLAAELERPVEEVRAVYELDLARLKQRATVTDYLPVLVERRARESLQRDDPR